MGNMDITPALLRRKGLIRKVRLISTRISIVHGIFIYTQGSLLYIIVLTFLRPLRSNGIA
jgi:hypothetical protein